MMKQLTVVLILVLATTNASSYFHPLYHYQQRSLNEDNYNDATDERDRSKEAESSNLLPRLTSLGTLQGWDSVPDPRMYVLTELESPDDLQAEMRVKRKGPSLSIVNPLDVLRQRLLIEMARRQKQETIQRNREILSNIGKRSIPETLLQSEFKKNNSAENKHINKRESKRMKQQQRQQQLSTANVQPSSL